MSRGLCFWILMLLWLVFGLWSVYPSFTLVTVGGTLLMFILLVLLGWQVFGAPIHG